MSLVEHISIGAVAGARPACAKQRAFEVGCSDDIFMTRDQFFGVP